MSDTTKEIQSQPQTWALALGMGRPERLALAAPGDRVLAIGCGTSAFMAQSYAALREQGGLGETDWAYASDAPFTRAYDRVVAVSRSGTTTEVLAALSSLPARTHRVVVTAVNGEPIDELAEERVLLDFADEASVVQTRFPTSFLALARGALGLPVEHLLRDAQAALEAALPVDVGLFEHFVYLGRGWTMGLALEAALKVRETAQAWSESYPGLEYRHGPIAVASSRSLVWIFGQEPSGLAESARDSGAIVRVGTLDPLAELVLAQRLAVALAVHRGLDPDHPRLLSRSVVLGDGPSAAAVAPRAVSDGSPAARTPPPARAAR